MATDVLCEVNNCTYWGSGNKCNAAAIYVVTNRLDNEAANSEETDCKTFEMKEHHS
ncbi:DUF1540 domain-containing protein [Solibacillus sp. FSL H8-0538]|uniref:DUF1540 domain-containing protein n=1 Tax=Solibacillus sp. FSL H8-0538 TaxID=2921400 RepID=UPI0030F60543